MDPAKTQQTEFGVAIFGLGRIGQVHLRNLCSDRRVRVRWLVDIEVTFPILRQLAGELNIDGDTSITTPDQAEKVFKDSRVDVVFVCTPVPTHEPLSRAALTAGKHVFTEKPLALSSEASEGLYELAKSQGRVLFCAFNRRYDPQLSKLHAALRRGDIGDLRMIKICSRDPPTMTNPEYMKLSGGMFLDCAIHDIDMAYWLSNEIPESVVAMGHAHDTAMAEIGDVDSIATMMKYKSGLVTIIDNSRHAAYGYDQRVEVLGSKGMLVSTNQRQSQLERWTESGTELDSPYFAFVERYGESYKCELAYFLDVLQGKIKPDGTGGKHVTLALKLALLCDKSRQTGRLIPL